MNISGARSNTADSALKTSRDQAAQADRRPLADEVLTELTGWQSHLRMAALQAWARDALSIVHLGVLAALEAHGPMSMTKLAETMDVSVASATGIVTRMEKRGVVLRHHTVGDRRIVLVQITEEGAKVSDVMQQHRYERLRTVIDALSDEELSSFLIGLRALGAARKRIHAEVAMQAELDRVTATTAPDPAPGSTGDPR